MFPLPLPHIAHFQCADTDHTCISYSCHCHHFSNFSIHHISHHFNLVVPPDPSDPGRAEVVSSSDNFGIGRSTPGEAVHLGILSGGHCTLKLNPSFLMARLAEPIMIIIKKSSTSCYASIIFRLSVPS